MWIWLLWVLCGIGQPTIETKPPCLKQPNWEELAWQYETEWERGFDIRLLMEFSSPNSECDQRIQYSSVPADLHYNENCINRAHGEI